jgi:hypothetical protein
MDLKSTINPINLEEILNIALKNKSPISLNWLLMHAPEIWSNENIVRKISDCCNVLSFYTRRKIKTDITPILEAIKNNPESKGLLKIVALLASMDQTKITYAKDLTLILAMDSTDNSEIKICIVLLRLLCGIDTLDEVGIDIFSATDDENNKILSTEIACDLLSNEGIEIEYSIKYLDAIILNLSSKNQSALSKTREVLRKKLDARRSKLTTKKIWLKELCLPTDAFNILQPFLESAK